MKDIEKILLYGNNIWFFGEGLLGPLFAVFAERIGGDILDISWAWAIFLVTTGALTIIVGALSDNRIKKGYILLTGCVLNALFTFSFLLVSEPYHLFIVEAGLGIALALAAPTWDALYSDYIDIGHSGNIWGLCEGEQRIVMGMGIVVGGLIVTYFSFTLLFLMMGTVQVISTLWLARILRRS